MLGLIDDALEPGEQTAANLETLLYRLTEEAAPVVLAPGDERNPIDADKKAMEALFAALEERGVSSPKHLSEFELYARLETYSKQAGRNH